MQIDFPIIEGLEIRPRSYLAVTVAAPASVGFVTGFGSGGLGCLLFLVALPLLPLALITLVALQAIRTCRWTRSENRTRMQIAAASAVPLAMLAVGPLLALAAARGGQYGGTITSLAIHLKDYRAIIAHAEGSRTARNHVESRGITYSVDPGPPVRVAFEQDGFLDNWAGIVYDPTGRVMEADGWDASGKFRAPDEITKLFGGDLVGCRHLWGEFYSCSFT